MKKILLNRAPRTGAWGGGARFVNSFFKFAPQNDINPTYKFENNIDAILVIDPRYDELNISMKEILSYQHQNPKVKIFQRINECDARKNTNDMDLMLRNGSCHLDHTFFVSNWMKSYHSYHGWNCKSNSVLYNGINQEEFIQQEKLSKKNNKINIVCAHWSDNFYKGQETYEFLDNFVGKNKDNFTFTFIGRTKCNFKNSKLIAPLSPEILSSELTKYDICVNASVYDPGPNAVIESISAGLPTYVCQNGGGAVEFSGEDHVFYSYEHLENILLSKKYEQNKQIFLSWETIISDLCKNLLNLT